MRYSQLNRDWNADPNAPEVSLSFANDGSIILEFYLNAFLFGHFQGSNKAKLLFNNCHKYSFNSMNDEGYHLGQYRYKHQDLPWGEFYQLYTNWQEDFPPRHEIIMGDRILTIEGLNHYIFFFKDNTFECVAESYNLEFLKK